MKILIIDDDPNKVNSILLVFEVVKKRELIERELIEVDIDICRAYNTGARKLMSEEYDGLLLDMGLPIFDEPNSEYSADQGMMILEIMKTQFERGKLKYKVPTMIISGSYFAEAFEFDNVLMQYEGGSDQIKDFLEVCQKEASSRNK